MTIPETRFEEVRTICALVPEEQSDEPPGRVPLVSFERHLHPNEVEASIAAVERERALHGGKTSKRS